MRREYTVSIYLDTRRPKLNSKYPVKLRVYSTRLHKQKLYPTVFNLMKEEFDSSWNNIKPRGSNKQLKLKLQAVEAKANEVAEGIIPFTFEQFERQLYRGYGEGININYHYSEVITNLRSNDQIGTADIYELSRKSLRHFESNHFGREFEKLTFLDITPEWLENYEKYMIESKGRTITTISIYLRSLRALFNKAMDENEIERKFYPFGKRKYQVPSKQNVKRTLTRDQLKVLFKSEPSTLKQAKAKDFWFFSYASNGMNIKDILHLRNKDIQENKIEFIRAKTRITSKANLKPITVFLNDFLRIILEKYRGSVDNPKDFVFNILSSDLSPLQQQKKIKNFTRFINQHIKKLAKANDLPEGISTYWARHSFSTNAIQRGASTEFVQESPRSC